MDFSLKYYDDIYNVQLNKHFHHCYRLDLIENEVSFLSIITDMVSGIIYGEKQSKLTFGSPWYSKYTFLYIDGEAVAKMKVRTGTLLSRKSFLEFKDGTQFHLKNKSYLFKNDVSYTYFKDGTPICEFFSTTKQKMISGPAEMNYQGEVTYDPKISNQQILLLLVHFCHQQINYNY